MTKLLHDYQSLANAIVSVAAEMGVFHMNFDYVMLQDDVIVYSTAPKELQEQQLWHDSQHTVSWASLFSKYVSDVLESFFKTTPRPLARSGVLMPSDKPGRLAIALHGVCERFDPGWHFYVSYDVPFVFDKIGWRETRDT